MRLMHTYAHARTRTHTHTNTRTRTHTAYFQRLRPFPRVLLRRNSALFKDYDKTPIGFGIVVFCIAKAPCQCVPWHLLQSRV